MAEPFFDPSKADTSGLLNIPGQSLFQTNPASVLNTTPGLVGSVEVPDTIKATEFNKPTTPSDTDALVGNRNAGIDNFLSGLNNFLAQSNQLTQNIASNIAPTEEETALSGQINRLMTSAEAGLNKIEDQAIPMGLITGQQASLERQANTRLEGLQRQLGLLQGTRQQKLQAAQFLYDANRNSIQDTLNIYKATAPENIGTQINQATGEVFVITKNPITGQTSTQLAGNIGANNQLQNVSIQTDPTTNNLIAIGQDASGNFVAKDLGVQGEQKLTYQDLGDRVVALNSQGNIVQSLPKGTVGIPGGVGGITPELGGAITTILGSGKFTAQQAQAIRSAIASGQDPVTVIKNQAKALLGATESGTLTKYEIARETLNDIGEQLKEFYRLGGETGLIKGNFEKVLNNLGKVNDPRLVELATQISGNLQVYRNAISGTAYSEQEGRDIASIFPGINKSETLNAAILSGRNKLFDSVIDNTYKTILGTAYETIKSTEQKQSTDTGNDPLDKLINDTLKNSQPSNTQTTKTKDGGLIGRFVNWAKGK